MDINQPIHTHRHIHTLILYHKTDILIICTTKFRSVVIQHIESDVLAWFRLCKYICFVRPLRFVCHKTADLSVLEGNTSINIL